MKRVHTQDYVNNIDKINTISFNKKWAEVMNFDPLQCIKAANLEFWTNALSINIHNWAEFYNAIFKKTVDPRTQISDAQVETPFLISENLIDPSGKPIE